MKLLDHNGDIAHDNDDIVVDNGVLLMICNDIVKNGELGFGNLWIDNKTLSG